VLQRLTEALSYVTDMLIPLFTQLIAFLQDSWLQTL
jgi:hypothetical protein